MSDPLQQLIDQVLQKYRKKYTLIGEGRHRAVFEKDENWVIKVPMDEYGLNDQYHERNTYQKEKDSGLYAACYIEHDDDLPLLIMERVNPVTDYKNLPKWTYHIDCQQVGYTSDGRLVAYDFGWH